MISKDSPISYLFIDFNIRGLVRTLNAMEGIRTMGSCGGHKNPTSIQQPEGHWFITFWVYKVGRIKSLPIIKKFCEDKGITLDGPYRNGYPAKSGWYSIEGKGCPILVNKELTNVLQISKNAALALERGS